MMLNRWTAGLGVSVAAGLMSQVAAALPPALPEPGRVVQEREERSGARAEVETTRIDFGTVWDHESPRREVVVRNVGTETLILTGERGSCGCTVPRIEPRRIEPGGEGVIKVAFDPRNRQGPQGNKYVTVQTNDPTRRQIRVDLSLTVKQAVRMEPRVLNFGRIGVNEMSSKRVSIYGRSADFEVEFKGERIAPGAMPTFLVSRAVRSEGDEPEVPAALRDRGFVSRVDFDVLLPPNSKVGSHAQTLDFTTNDTRAEELVLTARGVVEGDLVSQQPRLMLGQVESGPLEREMTIMSRSGTPFRVTGVTVNGPWQNAEATAEPVDELRDAWSVRIVGEPVLSAVTLRGMITVETDRPNEPTVRVQYFGYNREALRRQQQRQSRGGSAAAPRQTATLRPAETDGPARDRGGEGR